MEEEITLLSDQELDSFSSEDSLKMYLKEIKQYKVLPVDEQKKIANHYIAHKDKKSREILINTNLLLVVRIARKYYYSIKHLNLLDIIQEGNIGLIRAVETYNPNEGAFSTYAVYWIEQAIARSIVDKEKHIRKPAHIEEQTRKYINLVLAYEKMNKPLPSDQEICEKINVSESILKSIRMSLKQKVISLNTPLDNEEDAFLEDFIPDDNNDIDKVIDKLYDHDLCIILKEVLSPHEYYVVYKRFFTEKCLKLEQMANLLMITREGVRQLQKRAIRKIKPYIYGSQSKYGKLLKKIKDREGDLYNYLKVEPITPEQIIYYFYIKDTLTKLEDTLYKLTYFSKYLIPNKALILGLTEEEYANLSKSLHEKIKSVDKDDYFNYQSQMVEMYGKNIFNLIKEESFVSDNITLKRYLKSS